LPGDLALAQATFASFAINSEMNPNTHFSARWSGVASLPPDLPKVHDLIVGMRKKYYSVYDIQMELEALGHKLSCTAIWEILQEEGFARLMRRDSLERPAHPHPLNATVADVRKFEWIPRKFHSRIAGLFLLMPHLIALDLDAIVKEAKFPGTRMIPATHAVRSALALKLVGTERKSHVTDLIFDEALALFSGLNTSPKKSFLSEHAALQNLHYSRLRAICSVLVWN